MTSNAQGKELILPGCVALGLGSISTLLPLFIPITEWNSTWPQHLVVPYFIFFCAVFIILGVGMLYAAFRGNRTDRLKNDLKLRDPAPWTWDHSWNPEGIRTEVRTEIGRGALTSLGMLLFCGAITILAFSKEVPSEAWPLKAIISFLDLVTLWIIGATLWRISSVLKFGIPRLEFQSFPFFLGEEMRATLVFPRNLPSSVQELKIKLSYVVEEIVQFGEFNKATSIPVCTERFSVTQTIPVSEREVQFKIPQGSSEVGPTQLSARPPSYWDLEVQGSAQGQDLLVRFLVPIYDREKSALGQSEAT